MEENIVTKKDDPKINLSFRNLNYSVYCYGKEKCILKNISGIFKSGQISVILGPSGSGKTTLINILAGYRITKYVGLININNQSRDLEHFHKISRYIMQENLLLSSLTVLDIMMFAAEFKLDTNNEKLQVVNNILYNFNLVKVKNTLTENLSGGERKRLAIALELINNPAVIFLDEPTSGLDEQASFQCVSILKQLAKEGRTVICSIHAPSSRTFALFDHVYIMSDGQCVYQGSGQHILSFLEMIHLTCPIYYNPIDYFIDVSSGAYGDQLHKLVELTDNGKLTYPIENENISEVIKLEELHLESIPEYHTSTLLQLKVLLYRTFLQFYRNPTPFKFKFMMYSIMIVTFSALYNNCGNDATKIFTNVTYLFLSVCALMYCALMPPLIFFPLEIKIIRSEHFNRWYNTLALFLAQTLSVIPGYVIFTTLFVLITYPLTDQPLSATRMIKFICIGVLVHMVTDAFSMAIGSVLNVVNSFFLGVVIMIPEVCFTIHGYGFPFYWHPLIVKLLLRTCYLRYALEALMEVIYRDRSQHLICPDSEILCPVTTSKFIPYLLGFGTVSYWLCVAVLISFYVAHKCMHYLLLKETLNPGKLTTIVLRICNHGISLLCAIKLRVTTVF